MRAGQIQWWPPSLLPVALAAFHVLGFYVETGVSPFAILRVLFAAIVVSLALWVAASQLLGDSSRGSVVASIAILAFLGGGDLATVLLVGTLFAAVTVLLPRVLRVPFPWYLVTRAGNGLALILLITLLLRGGQNGTLSVFVRDIGWSVAGARVADPVPPTPSGPDIFVLMVEDYPRADTLARLFAFDNAPFLSALKDRGFTVSPRSRANYSNSLLTLLTMLQARHIEAIPELDGLRSGGSENPRATLRNTLNSGVTLDILRRHGYIVVFASSGYEQETLRSADRFFDAGQLNDFELAMISGTPIARYGEAWFLDLLGDQFRERIRAEFGFVRDIVAEDSPRPRFVLVHVPAPHPPIVFGPRGEPVSAAIHPYQYDLTDLPRFVRLFDGQLEYLNQLILDAVDHIERGATPAVTIVMSDEGIGWFNSAFDPDPDTRPLSLLTNLFAARTPGEEDLFGPAITPVNVMPILLERYLGEALPRQTDRNFISSDEAPFDGLEIPNTDADAAAP